MAEKEVVDLTATVPYEFSIESSSAKALRRFISEQGLSHNDCTTRSALQTRARDALQKRDGSAQAISNDIIEVIPQRKALKRRRRHADAVSSPFSSSSSSSSSFVQNDRALHSSEPGIECRCCFDGGHFENMVQCTEGHLFCLDCLKAYANQKLFGERNSAKLKCMESSGDGCEGFFREDMLRRALDEKAFTRWVEQEAAVAVKAAALPDLVSCPFCGLTAELDPHLKIFMCPTENGGCGRSSCRECGRKPHPETPRCEDVESDVGTRKRTMVEEAMTKARIRTCTNPNCGTTFFKTEGCNKMTCSSCGWRMCYLCRANIPQKGNAGYSHFCQTPHCQHKGCGKCPLFTDPIEDDRRAMLEAGKRAKAQAAKLVTNKARTSTLSSSSSDSSGEQRFQPLVRAKKADVEEVDDPEVNIERLLETAATPS